MMGAREKNLHLALTKALADAVAEAMAGLRAERLEELLAAYEETGTKQFSVNLPDGTKVATITLPEKKAFYEVDDEAAFLVWVRENHPEWVETVVVPPQPAATYETVSARQANAYLKGLAHKNGVPFDPKTGEVPDGVAYRPAGRPDSFQVRFEAEGRGQVIDAWRTGDLAELYGNDVFPQIGGAR